MEKIRIGIVGYGNVGKGAAMAVNAAPDMELIAIFTRRDPGSLRTDEFTDKIVHINKAAEMKDEIDVMLLCGGSATDLAEQGPQFAAMFNTVDSYDKHAKIPEYMASVNAVAKNTTAVISTGWDPGLFSIMRLISEAVLPSGKSYTFWGKGVSQGHSDAIRRIKGVKHAVQYTIPAEDAVSAARSGAAPELTARQKHLRDCYVAVEAGTDKAEIEKTIKTMPDYFAGYETTVTFVEADELFKNHNKMPHGGVVVRSGQTSDNKQIMEFSLKLESNPEFTGSIMTACARAAYRLSKEGQYGVKTVFDIPLNYFSEKNRDLLIKEML